MTGNDITTKLKDHSKLGRHESRKEINAYIGQRIRVLRKIKGLNQEILGSLLQAKITQQQMCKYEMGIDSIPASTLFEIAKILGVTIESFMPMDLNKVSEKKYDDVLLQNALTKALSSFGKYTHITAKEREQLEKSLTQLYKSK